MTEETIELARHDADKLGPQAAIFEGAFKALVREEKIVFSKCLLKHKDEAKNLEVLKALAHTDQEFIDHKNKIDEAQGYYLDSAKRYEAVIEWMRLATSWNYKENSRFKAGA